MLQLGQKNLSCYQGVVIPGCPDNSRVTRGNFVVAGIANIRFQQTEDGRIQLLAVPRASLEGERNRTESVQMDLEEEAEGTEVVGEVETLTLSHPLVRLDFFKATDGFSGHKHEDIVRETSKFYVHNACQPTFYCPRYVCIILPSSLRHR